jgi:hypothetical protein
VTDSRGSRRKVVVSIADEAFDRLDDVVARLKKAGLRVDQVLREMGMVLGHAPASKLAALRRTGGVQSVESEGEVAIPDPGEDVQ